MHDVSRTLRALREQLHRLHRRLELEQLRLSNRIGTPTSGEETRRSRGKAGKPVITQTDSPDVDGE